MNVKIEVNFSVIINEESVCLLQLVNFWLSIPFRQNSHCIYTLLETDSEALPIVFQK